MKVKVLRYKKEYDPNMEFVRIEDMGAGPEVFTSDLPHLHPETATLEKLKEYIETNDYYEGLELDWNTVEMVEFDLSDSGEVGADIRNKLTPSKNLVALLEEYFCTNEEEDEVALLKFIKKEMEQTEKSIKYIASLL